jgi:hypothetical protein
MVASSSATAGERIDSDSAVLRVTRLNAKTQGYRSAETVGDLVFVALPRTDAVAPEVLRHFLRYSGCAASELEPLAASLPPG